MSTTYHIQTWTGVRPQPFVSKLEVKSLIRGRSRVLGGIPGADSVRFSQVKPKDTTADDVNRLDSCESTGYLRYRP